MLLLLMSPTLPAVGDNMAVIIIAIHNDDDDLVVYIPFNNI